MMLNPLGQMLFMDISKRLRDLKWTVNDRDFHKEGPISEAAYHLPKMLVEREGDAELENEIAVLTYEGSREQFLQNELDGITLAFNKKMLEALGLQKSISSIKGFQTKSDSEKIQFFVDKPFADDEVQQWLEELFGKLSARMEEIYGDEIKDIPIVLLPTKLQELPTTADN
ncbi:hypothetical protein E2R51_09265 [Jeotgalibacillus sp. S-D1]|uniref:hypothetical protein n=1 Tax=Jeotgalibacillus sp. S-D1 TaxID=2552189 RepID=UPI00105AA26C|nr:hypothetical protein [Jeotgalibacillus sp. S-D1]TDL32848.1 hypothetical protein E2R51_09265 [Jeotgalibacillus sp. S-D1]